MNGPAEIIVLLRIDTQAIPEFALFYPESNQIGCLLLLNLMRRSLEDESLDAKELMGGGCLNDCVFIGVVSEPARALDVIKSALRKFALDGFCSMAFWDNSTDRLVDYFAGPAVRPVTYLLSEGFTYETGTRAVEYSQKTICALKKRLRTSRDSEKNGDGQP
jgi:hypothetical protein